MYTCPHCSKLKFLPFCCRSHFCPTCGNLYGKRFIIDRIVKFQLL
ncbi:MAG: transposase zinc-binding domain-containing protein [Eubacteriales bacterium]|nr:transposase zinc-binding domain-containing protein [Eubacteriales bacterium]